MAPPTGRPFFSSLPLSIDSSPCSNLNPLSSRVNPAVVPLLGTGRWALGTGHWALSCQQQRLSGKLSAGFKVPWLSGCVRVIVLAVVRLVGAPLLGKRAMMSDERHGGPAGAGGFVRFDFPRARGDELKIWCAPFDWLDLMLG